MRKTIGRKVGFAAAGASLVVGGLVVTADPADAAGPIDPTYLSYAVPQCTQAILANPAGAVGYLTVLLSGTASPFGGCVSGGPL